MAGCWFLVLSCAIFIGACSLFAPLKSTGASIEIEELSNGYLIHIVTDQPVGEVSAFLSSGNWLLITIADSTIEDLSIESIHSEFVDSAEVNSFPSAVQISLHLTMIVDALDVLHEDQSSNIMISVFTRKEPLPEEE
jgi:HAMP domain-containing protein